ncbi:MAG: hypothetical protein PHT91_00380 [Candidatus Nanoarchaeia archaeon]|nr:hypothetical protein [Candidatus Nanoarchaeia archaeon]MDD5053936.1 hypothetical protein [Candidatus Nanoarchaeia archaeon]MDD5499315.1 hypothetical protein [Candidatus Nanoarchaeia archaeon]
MKQKIIENQFFEQRLLYSVSHILAKYPNERENIKSIAKYIIFDANIKSIQEYELKEPELVNAFLGHFFGETNNDKLLRIMSDSIGECLEKLLKQ